jgi:tetratricopeptide (TPR) repeat protein
MGKLIVTILLSLASYVGFSQATLKPEFDKAVKFLKSEDYENAEKGFTGLLAKATDIPLKKYCFIYRAFSYNGLGEYTKAIADLDQAIGLDPSDIASYTDRGKAKGYANDLVGARKDFEHVLSQDSTGKQAQAALYYLGKITYQQVQFEQSISYYDKYLLLVPGDPEVYFNRGAAKDMIMDPAGAIKDYDKAIQLDPDYKEAYANRGVAKINLLRKNGNIQLTKDQTTDACADFKKAKQLGDNAVDDLIWLHCEKK